MIMILVPNQTMDKITALCDVIIAENKNDATTKVAKEIRSTINKGLTII